MNTFNHYLHFTAARFANDPSFWNWVLREGTDEEDLFWEAFYSLHPSKRTEMDEARRTILNLDEKKLSMPDERIGQLWKRIESGINESSVGVVRFSFGRMGMAASIAGLLLMAAVSFFMLGERAYTSVKTNYGSRKEIRLPDGSSLILNGNSSLRYAADSFCAQRQVWVEGEVYFNVVHTRSNQEFTVHTNDLDIQVLGTSFNVNSRAEKTDVVLSAGKIRLNIPETRQQLMMKPGERVRYRSDAEGLKKEKVNVVKYTAWRQNRLIFENDSLAYVFEVLRDSYNLKLTVEDANILKKKITARVPADQPKLLLKGLSEAHGLKFTKREGGWLVTYN